ncbi:MAG TPA: SDR family oxidoreductase [Acidimicrobiales bacterium]|nr:SDR family oxidoreductase [Acidimicrobiales bacterium]
MGRRLPGRLEGEVALVTGAWRGIGAAAARAFSAEGAAVAINYPPRLPAAKDGADRLARELRDAGAAAMAVEADVSDRANVTSMVEAVRAGLGPVGVLVSNAATTRRMAWTEIDEAEWDRVMHVNLTGALFCAQTVYPSMKERGRGKIITVSSVMVELGAVNALHYVSSKAALVGMTRSLAREVGGDGICVNCVMPGAIRTENEEELFPGRAEQAAREQAVRQSIPRRGLATDLAGTFVFLASAESDFVTGQVIVVDGGWVNY